MKDFFMDSEVEFSSSDQSVLGDITIRANEDTEAWHRSRPEGMPADLSRMIHMICVGGGMILETYGEVALGATIKTLQRKLHEAAKELEDEQRNGTS